MPWRRHESGEYVVANRIRSLGSAVSIPAKCQIDGKVSMNRLLVALGAILILLGLVWPWIRRLPLFRLPGDIVIDRPGFKFFFPITTMLLVSAVISTIAWLFRK